MAAESSYDGGAGGKFRKRPFRRPASTPYDRPPSAVRPAHRAINTEGEGNRWYSMFIDPKRIMSAASQFLTSVGLRKGIGAPHPAQAPDAGIEAREEAINLVPDSSNVPSQSPNESPSKENPNADGISELEKMLEQKTFTRAQFDQLTKLLRSRTVESSGAPESIQSEPNASRPDTQLDTEQNLSLQILEKRVNDGSSTRATVDMNVLEKEIASPAELAKAYMVSRPSKLSTPIAGLQSPAFREATPLPINRPPMPKASDLAVVPRSMIRLSGPSENGYKTPRSQGRSAIYKMSRSPYFKAQSLLPSKGIGSSEQSHARASNSQLVPSDVSHSKQVLKRGSSFMENDVGSFGPIRRIRQKSNLITPEKDVSGRYFSTPANKMHVSMSSIQKPLLVDALSHHNLEIEDSLASQHSAPVPTRSVQMASKIFEQLYLLGSPLKEKTSELQVVSKDESPTKLSINMLNGQALMSLKDTDACKTFSFEDNRHSNSNAKDHITSVSAKLPTVENNGPTSSAVGTKSIGAADGPMITVTDVSQKRPAFLMQVPEVSSDGDIENQGGNDTANISNTVMEPLKQVSKPITSEISPKKSPVSSAEVKSNADLVTIKESGMKRDLSDVPGKDNGFSFPVTSSKSSSTQPPPTPTMPSPTLNQLGSSKEEGSEPVFTFGSGRVSSVTFSSVASDSNATLPSEPKADIFVSSSTTRTTQLELPKFVKGKETEKIGDSLKPFQSSTSNMPSSVVAPTFSFGASASSGLSNGSLKPMPSMFSASATPALPLGVSGTVDSSSPSPAHKISSSSASALTSFPAISSTSASVGLNTTVLTDADAPVTKSMPQGPVVLSSKDSIFSTKNDLAGTTTAAFASSVTGIFGLSSAASASTPGSASAPLFGSQSTSSVNGSSVFGQSTSSAISAASSAQGSGVTTSPFGFTASGFGSSSTSASPFSFGLSTGSSNFSTPSTSLTSQMTTSSLFTSSGASASNLFSSSSGSSLSSSVTAPSIFASASQPAAPSIFGSGSTSSTFSFGQSPTVSGASSFSFGSSGTTFSFSSAPSITAATASPASVFGTPPVTFGASSPGNDQMNVEDSMTDDTVQSQTAMPIAPAFGQATNTAAPSTFSFGSPQPSGSVPFQFGSQPTAAFPQAQSPFQSAGNPEFGGVSGSFSLGSGGGGADRSARKIIRVRKDNKNRKK